MTPYNTPLDTLCKDMEVDPSKGLTTSSIDSRLAKYGQNVLTGKKKISFIQRFFSQFKDTMTLVLLAAAAISLGINLYQGHHDFVEPLIIVLIVVLNAFLGAWQENSAEKSLDALKDMSAPSATVLRDGSAQKISSKDVVPGDIVLLEAGDLIPADGRLIEAASLKCEESALTGESVPVEKDASVEIADGAPLGDRINMVYSGCSVSYGRGSVLVTSTGMHTEMGKIADLLNANEQEETPLQVRLNKVGKYMGLMAIAICVIIFVLGEIKGEPPLDMFMTAVSLAVAAIPEGLTTVVTLVLSLGVQKMVKKHAIIRRLPAVETLGSTSVICSDKTGTLTQNKMTVKQIWAAGSDLKDMTSDLTESEEKVVLFNALCNDSKIIHKEDGNSEEIGDPTEIALVAAAELAGMNPSELAEKYPRVGEIPFDSERKLMTTINLFDGKPVVVVKGGYDVLLPRCIAGDRSNADEINLTMGKKALRVLAVAYKEIDAVPESYDSDSLENGLTFVGLVGMIDPPREESKEAIARCKDAGIKTVMITGDHVVTATAIAKELGILEDESESISGVELNAIDDETLIKNVRKYSVYARVSPEDKIRIVKAWQANGEVVAMTGDGVNDAPALAAADIGCAMGITGTEVAKGAAAMVLTDDNFSTIVSAVEEGRTIYDNIKKTIEFLLGSNIGEVIVVFLAMLFGWGTPLISIQLLMVNVVTDAFPAFALGFEAPEKGIMKKKPIPRDEGVFANGLGLKIVLQGIMVGGLTLAAFYIGKYSPLAGVDAEGTGRTMAFLTLCLVQLVQAYNCRSHQSLFKAGFFNNRQMNLAFIVSLAVALLITLVPALESIFQMVDLPLANWGVVIGLSLSAFVFVEIGKLIVSIKNKGQKETAQA